MKITLFNQQGEEEGKINLPKEIFDVPKNDALIFEGMVRYFSNMRSGNACTKTRGEVRGGSRKPWRQKGTGRARQGTNSSPIWRGGGVVFGPKGKNNFEKKMPKKMRRKALFSALSVKQKEKIICGLNNFNFKDDKPKTKLFAEFLVKIKADRKILLVLNNNQVALEKSVRNIPEVKTIKVHFLNIPDVLKAHKIIFLSSAIDEIKDTFLKS